MVVRQRHAETVLVHEFELQARKRIQRIAHDAQVERPIVQAFDNAIGGGLVQLHVDARVGALQLRQCLRQQAIGALPTKASRRVPTSPLAASRARNGSLSACRRICMASGSSSAPASVSVTPRRPRTNSLAPSLDSSCAMETDSAGCAIWSCSAARRRFSSVATTQKWRRLFRFMLATKSAISFLLSK